MSLKLSELPIIDVHNHVFPDKIANRAAKSISEYYSIPMDGDGTLKTLLDQGEGIRRVGIVLSSAATHARSVESANRFISAACKSDPRLIGFGSFHAEYENFAGELANFPSLGLVGVKFHTDFQGFPIDDERLFPLYALLEERKMPVLFHAGDAVSPLSRPRLIARVHRAFPALPIIAAHMGGYLHKEEVEEYLLGEDVYFDSSEWNEFLTEEEFYTMARAHGIEKILYGTDYPIHSPAKVAKETFAVPFTDEEKKRIFYQNAASLFGLQI